jgi:outer membrane receptor for ferrienterochelin and colicins
MRCLPLRLTVLFASTALLLGLLPIASAAQTSQKPDVAGMSLEDLLAVEVSTASKFPQVAKEAPASITVITAQEIHRFGYRTLADALRSVRGFYSTYDRNYAYLGMRGFARPGDYNTRILLLIDGHRVNDGVYDMAPMGTDFLVDLPLIERIEVIRGPGSSLYGTNALFGVVNVITKTGAGRQGVQADFEAGSLETFSGAGSYGRVFGDGRELLFAGSAYRSSGQESIHYPEFDETDPPAIAEGIDHDDAWRLFGSLSVGRFSLRGGAVHRYKQVPTASFGTAFNDDRLSTTDDRAFVDGVYEGPLGGGWMATARLAYDFYGYEGGYPTPVADVVTLFTDQSRAHAVSGELTARRRFGRKHLFTAGAEIRSDLENRQRSSDETGEYLNVNAPGTKAGVYIQDEIRPTGWLLLNAGLRLDRFSDFGTRATPRAGIVLLPRERTAIKLLYGSAFRAPNPYERYYYTSESPGPELLPEQVVSSEVVWEESLSKQVRLTVTAFSYDVERIIEQRASAAGDIFFENSGSTHGRGFEVEAEARFDSGLVARAGHTYARVRDRDGDQPVSNSPQNLTTVSFQAPVSRLFVAVEGQYVGERLSLDGSTVGGYFAPNVTLTSATSSKVGFGLSIYNALNRTYAHPGAEEHRQSSIQQDGRTVHLRVHFRF